MNYEKLEEVRFTKSFINPINYALCKLVWVFSIIFCLSMALCLILTSEIWASISSVFIILICLCVGIVWNLLIVRCLLFWGKWLLCKR